MPKFDGDAKVWLGFPPLVLSFFKVSQSLLDHFHCVSANLPKKKVDIVIVDIPSNLLVPYVFDPTFSILSWNQSVDNFIDSRSLCFLKKSCSKMELCYFSMSMICMC